MVKSRIKRLFSGAHLRGMLRVLGLLGVLSAAGTVVALRTAHAGAERALQNVGESLLKNLGPLVIGEPQRVAINGQNMFIASNVTELAPKDVMNRFEGYCREHSGGLAKAIDQLPTSYQGKKVPDELRDPAGWLTTRSDSSEDLGQITCFVREDEGTLEAFFERVAGFFETGDVSKIGELRYAVARRTEAGKTHVLAIWTDRHFNLFDMFPESGDAPGSDAAEAPRPPDAVRLLSSELGGHPHAARVYDSKKSPAEVLAFYDAQMPSRGFIRERVWLEAEDDEFATAAPSYARAFSKDGALIVISALVEPTQQEGTQVGVISIGGTTAHAVVTD